MARLSPLKSSPTGSNPLRCTHNEEELSAAAGESFALVREMPSDMKIWAYYLFQTEASRYPPGFRTSAIRRKARGRSGVSTWTSPAI